MRVCACTTHTHTHTLSQLSKLKQKKHLIPPSTITARKTDSPTAVPIISNSHQDYLCPANFKKQFSSWELKYNGPWDFPGGTVDKNPPANAGDTGSIPGPGRCHEATKPMRHNY